jgi:hypothetical protein
MGICFHRGPAFGEHGGALFHRAFLFRRIFIMFLREMQMPCKWGFPSIGAPLGNMEGVHLPGFLREKKKYIWVPFLGLEAIKILSLGDHLEL